MVFRSWQGWEMSLAMFCSWGRVKLVLLMKMISDGFPTSRKKPISFHQLSPCSLCNLASDFVTLAGGVWTDEDSQGAGGFL